MSRLSDIAKNIVGIGGEYISVNDIIANYPEGITINGVSIRDGKEIKHVPCFTFAEDSTKYFYAVSGDLAKIYGAWLSECDNSVETLNEELSNVHIQIALSKVKTKSNKTYVKVKIIGTIDATNYENVDFETGEVLSDEEDNRMA